MGSFGSPPEKPPSDPRGGVEKYGTRRGCALVKWGRGGVNGVEDRARIRVVPAVPLKGDGGGGSGELM